MHGTFLVGLTCLLASVALSIMPLTKVLDLGAHLAASAAAIQRILNVRVVVFGHHHKPRREDLPGGAVYLNAGAWVSSGIERSHSHVVVLRRDDGTVEASLRIGRDFLPAQDEPCPEMPCPEERCGEDER